MEFEIAIEKSSVIFKNKRRLASFPLSFSLFDTWNLNIGAIFSSILSYYFIFVKHKQPLFFNQRSE